MPPVPPGNRSNKGMPSRSNNASKDIPVENEHHPNAAEKGDTANIKQNRTQLTKVSSAAAVSRNDF
jgi:hypothetical protein